MNNPFEQSISPTQNSYYTPTGNNNITPVNPFEESLKPDLTKPTASPIGPFTVEMPYNKAIQSNLTSGQYLYTPDSASSLENYAAHNQGFFDLTGKVAVQSFGELASDLLQDAGTVKSAFDGDLYKRLSGDVNSFSKNLFEQAGADVRQYFQDAAPILQTDEAKEGLALTDKTYWASLSPSIVSGVASFLATLGIGKGIELGINGVRTLAAMGKIGEAGKLVEQGINASEAVQAVNNAMRLKQFSPYIFTTESIIPAVIGRTLDSSQEALNSYQDTYNNLLPIVGEAKAKDIAAQGASNGFQYSYGNILFDIAEWTSLMKNTSKFNSAIKDKMNASLLNNEGIKSMLGDNTEKVLGLKNGLLSNVLGKIKGVAEVGIPEGFDETFMDYFMNEGKRKAFIDNGLIKDDGTTPIDRLIKHHEQPKNWDSFIGGFLGGVGMNLAHTGINYATDKFDTKGKAQLTNLSNDFANNIDNIKNTLSEISRQQDAGNIVMATKLNNDMMSDVIHKASSQNMLDYYLEFFENMNKLTPDEKSQLNMGDIDAKNINLTDMISSIKDAKKIYQQEASKLRYDGSTYDSIINSEIAKLKTNIYLNDKIIKQEDITPTTIDESTKKQLFNIDSLADVYYDNLKSNDESKHKSKLNIETLQQSKSFIEASNLDYQETIQHLQDLAMTTKSKQSKLVYENKIKNYQDKITLNESLINDHNVEISNEENNIKSLDDNMKLFKESTSLDKDKQSKIEDIYNNTKTAKQLTGDSLHGALKQENYLIQKRIEFYQSKKGFQFVKDVVNNHSNEEVNNFKQDFINNLDLAKNETSINQLLHDYLGNNKIHDPEIITEVTKLANNKIKELAKQENLKKASTIDKSKITIDESEKITKEDVKTNKDVIDESNELDISSTLPPTGNTIFQQITHDNAFDLLQTLDVLNKTDNIKLIDLSNKLRKTFSIDETDNILSLSINNDNINSLQNIYKDFGSLSNFVKTFILNNTVDVSSFPNIDFQSIFTVTDKLDDFITSESIINDTVNDLMSDVKTLTIDNGRMSKYEKSIIDTLQNIQLLHSTPNKNYMTELSYHLFLFDNLLKYKKYLTGDNNTHISVEDSIRIIKQSLINTNNILDFDELKNITYSLPSIFNFVKEHLQTRSKIIFNKRTNSLKNKLESNDDIVYDSDKNDYIYKSDNSVVEWESAQDGSEYYKLKTLSDAIIFHKLYTDNKSITNSNLDKIIYEDIDNSRDINLNYDSTLNQDLITNENKDLYSVLQTITPNDKLDLKLNDNGDIEIYHDSIIEPISIISNLERGFNGINIIKDNIYKGLTDILKSNDGKDSGNILLKTAFNTPSTISKLEDYFKSYLKSKSNNLSKTIISQSKSDLKGLVSLIQNNESSDYENIRNIIDLFKTNNMTLSEIDAYTEQSNIVKYTQENIDDVLNVLFFGRTNMFIDDFKPSYDDTIKRINYFDNVAKIKYNKYITLKDSMDDDIFKQCTLSDISKPSIKFNNNPHLQNSILDTIKPVSIDGKTPKIVIINNTKNGVIDSSNGSPISSRLVNLSNKKNGLYVIVKSTSDKYSFVPVKASTIKNSYTKLRNSNSAKDGQDFSSKAVKYVSNSISNCLFSTTDDINTPGRERDLTIFNSVTPMSDELKSLVSTTNEHISSILNKGLKQVTIYGSNDGLITKFPYLHIAAYVSEDGLSVERVVRCTTINRDAKGKTNTEYHKFIVKNNKFYHFYIDDSRIDNLGDVLVKLDNYKISNHLDTKSGIKSESYTIGTTTGSISEQNFDKVQDILTNVSSKLLRQTHYNSDGIIDFGTTKTGNAQTSFTCPITGITYDNATDYALLTDGIYSDVDTIGYDDNNEPISNLDLNTTPVRISVNIPEFNTITKGLISNPIESLKNSKLNISFKEVLPIITAIDNKLSHIPQTHEGIEFNNDNQNVIAQLIPQSINGKLTLNYKYTDLFKYFLSTNNLIDNPVLTLLHEHIHAVISSAFTDSILINKPDVFKTVIKAYNDEISNIINQFEKDFNNHITLEDNELNTELITSIASKMNLSNKTYLDIIHSAITYIKESVEIANKNLEDGNLNTTSIAQEMFTYLTNPYFMQTLSIVTPSINFNIKESPNTFIGKIIDTLMKVYNKICSLMGIKFNIDNTNYLKNIRDLLNNLYTDFAQGTISYDIKPVTDIKNETNIQSTTILNESDFGDLDFGTSNDDLFNNKVLDIKNINTIFTKTNNISRFKDDNALDLC